MTGPEPRPIDRNRTDQTSSTNARPRPTNERVSGRTESAFDRSYGRRRFLALTGFACVTTLAGCAGDADRSEDAALARDVDGSDDIDDGNGRTDVNDEGADADDETVETDDGTDQNTAGDETTADPAVDCPPLDDSAVPWSPSLSSFVFTYDHPETWAVYFESETDETTSMIASHVGHAASAADGEYPFHAFFQQGLRARDDGYIDHWSTYHNFEPAGTITYGEAELEVTADESGNLAEWRVAVPDPGSDDRYPVQVIAYVDPGNDYAACAEPTFEITRWILESLRPNPDYASSGNE